MRKADVKGKELTDFERLARRRRRIVLGTAIVALLGLVLGGLLALSQGTKNHNDTEKTHTAYGVVSIASKAIYVTDPVTGCRGIGNYTDLAPGGLVTITDINGNTLTTTRLATGKVDDNGFCELAFTAPGVPTNKGPYGIQITRRKLVQDVNQSDLFTRVVLTFG